MELLVSTITRFLFLHCEYHKFHGHMRTDSRMAICIRVYSLLQGCFRYRSSLTKIEGQRLLKINPRPYRRQSILGIPRFDQSSRIMSHVSKICDIQASAMAGVETSLLRHFLIVASFGWKCQSLAKAGNE
jgi:hypothetical protein